MKYIIISIQVVWSMYLKLNQVKCNTARDSAMSRVRWIEKNNFMAKTLKQRQLSTY